MTNHRLSFEQRKFVLKWYWKHEDIIQVQKNFRKLYDTSPPTRRAIYCIRDKFEKLGTVNNIQKGRSGRPRSITGDQVQADMLEKVQHNSGKSVRQIALELGISKSSAHRILKRNNLNSSSATSKVSSKEKNV